MKQIFRPYWEWEDWANGMWRKLSKEKEAEYILAAIIFTGDHEEYGKAMMEVIVCWKNTMLHNLTNPSINKLAFVGHCACCYKTGCPEYITRMAWRKLTDTQRCLANEEAKKAIDWYFKNAYGHEKEDKGIREDMGVQMLFKWDSR